MASTKRDDGRASDSERPAAKDAAERISALDERLAKLRGRLEERSSARDGDERPSRNSDDAGDVESLALLVFNTFKGDPTKLRHFVHALGRLTATKSKPKADGSGANEP